MADSKISNLAALAACDAVVDLLDAGSGAGTIKIYSGSAPATADAEATGTLLATLTLSDPAFGSASDTNPGAIATASTITRESSAANTGTAGYFRACDSAANPVLQGTVTAEGGGGDMELSTIDITRGDVVSVLSWTVSLPEGI